MMMKHSAVGQRERATVVTKSHIDKIYTDGFKDGVRKMQERLNAERGYDYEWHYNSWWGETIDQVAKELLEEDT